MALQPVRELGVTNNWALPRRVSSKIPRARLVQGFAPIPVAATRPWVENSPNRGDRVRLLSHTAPPGDWPVRHGSGADTEHDPLEFPCQTSAAGGFIPLPQQRAQSSLLAAGLAAPGTRTTFRHRVVALGGNRTAGDSQADPTARRSLSHGRFVAAQAAWGLFHRRGWSGNRPA